MRASQFLSLLAVAAAVSAIPLSSPPSSLPSSAVAIAYNEDNDSYVVFDNFGSEVGIFAVSDDRHAEEKRDNTGGCTALTVDQAKLLPGWSKVEAYAQKQWGKGYSISTNRKEYPNSLAKACMSNDLVAVQADGPTTCSDSESAVEGVVQGTTGSVTLTLTQGYSNSGTYTVSKTSTSGVNATISAGFSIPGVGSVSPSVTAYTSVTNSEGSAFTTNVDNMVSTSLTIQSAAGDKCSVRIGSKTCHVNAKGKVRNVADGWVWFSYKSKKQGHYRWGANLASILSLDERSTWLEFQGAMTGTTKSSYDAACKAQ